MVAVFAETVGEQKGKPMTTTIESQKTDAQVTEAQKTDAQTAAEPAIATSPNSQSRRWVPRWVVSTAIVAAAAALVATLLIGSETGDDGSFQLAETQRMAALALVSVSDGSFESAEFRRLSGLGPDIDGSHDVAEYRRMIALQR